MATVDCEKAFDMVSHEELWKVLVRQGVPPNYVSLIKSLYSRQSARVMVGVESREFSVERGVKQGDPLSALLFLAVMQDMFGSLEQRWENLSKRRKGKPLGIHVGEGQGRALTDLRFANDVLLVATSKADISKMLTHVMEAGQKYGLKINFEKTKILTWDHYRHSCTELALGEHSVKILPEEEAEKYLGRKLSFKSSCQVELQNRIDAAWAAFHVHKGELCCKHYSLKDRCRLFDATVSPTLLYGCAAWALTPNMVRMLQTQWRRMLRYVFCSHRRHEETWVEYMQRSAHDVEHLAKKHGLKPWTNEYRLRKWRFAGRLARQLDGRWSSKIISWMPSGARRARGRPKTRWATDFEVVAGGGWLEAAKDNVLWTHAERLFASQGRFPK